MQVYARKHHWSSSTLMSILWILSGLREIPTDLEKVRSEIQEFIWLKTVCFWFVLLLEWFGKAAAGDSVAAYVHLAVW